MSKARRIVIVILGWTAAFCEWGATLTVPQGLLVLTGSVPLKSAPQEVITDFWVKFTVESLYLLLLVSLGLWAHTRVFYRLRWVISTILILQGIDRFFDAMNTPWMPHYICTCFPMKVLDFVASALAFVLAYLIVSVKRPQC